MKYNFDEMTDRRNTGSLKWDVAERELPLWVADMDFKTAPAVREAIEDKARQGIFGYSVITEEWYQAIIGWWERRHHFLIEKDWLIFSTGVIPSISSIVRKLTCVGENVVVQTPVYNIFFNSILNNGRNVLENKLIYDGTGYSMDFEDLERKLADPQTSMMFLCNPQNPAGKIWDKETLERVGELCAKYHVLVVSDEIHCDITEPGKEYVPFASVSEVCRNNSITCIAPTKAFNIAGIQTSAVMVPDDRIHHKVWRGLNTDEVAEPNVFAIAAATAAFTQGDDWLDELRVYLWENRKAAEEYLERELPMLKAVKSDATYLMWIDCNGLEGSCKSAGADQEQTQPRVDGLADRIRKTSGLYLCDGEEYRNGKGFLRLNLACPRERLMDGMERLKKGILQEMQV